MNYNGLILISMAVILLFGFRQFNQWTEKEARNEGPEYELVAFAPPKSFTPFPRFFLLSVLYCASLLSLYAILLVILQNPPLGGEFLKIAGVTPENAWLAALFVVTGLSPILPLFSQTERALREVMHTWAVVPGKALQMADQLASPGSEFQLDERFLHEVTLPRVGPQFTSGDFPSGTTTSIAEKWCRLHYLLYRFAPPAKGGVLGWKVKSPYTTRFYQNFLVVKKEVGEFATATPSELRSFPSSPDAVDLSDRIDNLQHQLFILMSCHAFSSRMSWEGVRAYMKQSYGVDMKRPQDMALPTGPIFDGLMTVTVSVFVASYAFLLVFPDRGAEINPFVWACSALATHGLGVLVGWFIFAHKKRHTEDPFYEKPVWPLSREYVVAAILLGFVAATPSTWLATVNYLDSVGTAEWKQLLTVQAGWAAFQISWPWGLLGSATAFAVYFHLERTASTRMGLRDRFVSGIAQALLNLTISTSILVLNNPFHRSIAEQFGNRVTQLVLLLTALIGLLLGYFLPDALYRHGHDRRGAKRYRPVSQPPAAVLTCRGHRLQGEVIQMSATGCLFRPNVQLGAAVLGRYGNITLKDGTVVPARATRDTLNDIGTVDLAMAFSAEGSAQQLQRPLLAKVEGFLVLPDFELVK